MKQFLVTIATAAIVGLIAAGGVYVYLNETRIKPLSVASAPTTPVAPTSTSPVAPSCPTIFCAETPQVFYFNKLAFTSTELSEIRTNVVDPIVSFYRDQGKTVVSINIKRQSDSAILIDAIVDQPGTSEPISYSTLYSKTGGSYQRWQSEGPGPGYQG